MIAVVIKCPCLIVSYGGITHLTAFTAVGKTEIGLWKTRAATTTTTKNNLAHSLNNIYQPNKAAEKLL